MNKQDVCVAIAECALLRSLSADECAEVMANGRLCHLRQGEFFFHQGEDAQTMYILAAGRAKLTQITADGTQVIVNYFSQGDGLGIIVALSNMPYPLSAEAVEECWAMAWTKECMKELMFHYPQLALNGINMIGHRFAQLQERYQEVATQRVEQRVARALLRLVRQFGKRVPEGVLIDMPLTREDLAQMTGTNLYNVSRILSKWEHDGLVDTGRKRVTLCKPHALVVIAEDLPPPRE